MEKKSFLFEGKEYPARITMGALRAFRKETGNDFLKIQDKLTGEDLGVMLWAAISRQSKVEGVPFEMSLDDFLDRVTPDEVSTWYVGTVEETTPEDKTAKKKKARG